MEGFRMEDDDIFVPGTEVEVMTEEDEADTESLEERGPLSQVDALLIPVGALNGGARKEQGGRTSGCT